MMKRFMIVLLLSLGMVSSSIQEVRADHYYHDVPYTYRFADEIQRMVDLDIVDATRYFRPKEAATRAEVADMLVRTYEGNGKQPQRETPFKDVPKSHPYSGSIQLAVEYGILSGFPDGTFRPDAPVTRGQTAILFVNTFDSLNNSFMTRYYQRVRFQDMTISMKAYEAVQRMVLHSITNGFPDRTYRPNAPVQRGQLAYFIDKALDNEVYEELMNRVIENDHLTRYGDLLVFGGGSVNELGHYTIFMQFLDRNQEPPRMRVLRHYGYAPYADDFYDETERYLTGKQKLLGL